MGMERIDQKLHIARRGVWCSLVLCRLILLIGGVGFWILAPAVHTLADGLWLAFSTAATVGHGDVVPSAPASRGFAVVVVLLGWAVLSIATASQAAIFVEKDMAAEEDQRVQDLLYEIHLLCVGIRVLRGEVRHLRASSMPP